MIRTKKKQNTFAGGIDQDTIVTKFLDTHYFDAQNMRILTNESNETGGINSIKGNVLKLQFAANDEIIGFCKIRSKKQIDTKKDSIVFFVHNVAAPTSKIYLFEGDPNMVTGSVNMDVVFAEVAGPPYTYRAGYIYRDSALAFDPDYPIKAEGRYESDDLRKVYWVDGLNNIRYMILDNVAPTDDPEIFNINPQVELTAPVTALIPGGAYLAGKVQHSYQLYVKNGAATTYAPVSSMLSLTSKDGGPDSRDFAGDLLNERTGKAVQVALTDLDNRYNRVRVVALHYTEYLINPTVRIVGEYEYLAGEITVVDNGITSLGTVPLEEFRLFGQTNYIANYLASKNNYLFFADLLEDKWNPTWLDPADPDFFDCRAVRFGNIASSGSGSGNITLGTESGGSSMRHGVNGVTFTFGAFANQMDVQIDDMDVFAPLGGGKTWDAINSITCLPGVYTFFDIEWKDIFGNDPLVNYHRSTGTSDGITFENILLAGSQLNFTVTYDATIFNMIAFPADFDTMSGLNPSDLFAIKFDYDWVSAPGTTITATVDDTSFGSVDIFEPVDKTVKADWYDPACRWGFYPFDHDGINIYNNFGIDNFPVDEYGFNFQSDGATIGAEGPNVTVGIAIEEFEIDNGGATAIVKCNAPYADTPIVTDHVSSARTEVYRIFIVFFNTKMQFSNPQWVCDFRMPNNNEYNLAEMENITQRTLAAYLYPQITLRNMPTDPELYGWQVFRCERGSNDRSVMASGLISSLLNDGIVNKVFGASPDNNFSNYLYIPAEDYVGAPGLTDHIVDITSPEISFNKSLRYSSNDYFRIDGRYTNPKDFYILVDNGTVSNDSDRYTLILQSTSSAPRTDNLNVEEWLYKATEGYLQTPSEWTGDPLAPDWPVPTIVYTGDPKEYSNAYFYERVIAPIPPEQFSIGSFHGNGGYVYVAVNGDNALIIDTGTSGWLYGSYLRDVFYVQYGGITYEARSYNQVIPYSPLMIKADLVTTCIYGDTHIGMYTHLRSAWPYLPPGDPHSKFTEQVVSFPVESSINLFYRNDQLGKYYQPLSDDTDTSVILENTVEQGLKLQPVDYPLDLGDLYTYNSVYSKSGSGLTIQCLPFDQNMQEYDDSKVIATGKKFNNEYWDQWTNLYTNNYITLDPKFGPIRNIFNFNNNLYSGQDKGVAILSVNDRSVIQDSSQLQLVLGTGDVLPRYDYLTVTSGFQNYFDMGLSDKGFYYIDRRAKSFYSLSADQGDMPISDFKGYRSFMKKYGIISEIQTGYDPLFKEFFFYITDGSRSYNSAYGELTSAFMSKHTFFPDRMFHLNDQFYSAKDDQVWIHNQGAIGSFYGNVSDSWIEMIINPETTNICRFDILDLRTRVMDEDEVTEYRDEQFDTMEISNNYQSTNKVITWSGDDSSEDTSKSIVGQWRTWLLPDDQTADFYRFADTYLRIKLIKDNTLNRSITLHDTTTFYRPTKN